ncbi:S9 family peptidase [Sphingobium aquiterrae]|uniref:S9 family peptidase n=1 Tax=Sphingobium aquiterrae TaxID=2038656 RepID=UPI00301699B8
MTAPLPVGALVSPLGQRAIWPLADGSGFEVADKLSNGSWSAPRKLRVRGVVRAPIFSPDGRYVAFENIRGGYPTGAGPSASSYSWSFIAVHDFSTGETDYAEPSFALDSDPAWVDSGTISFTRRVSGLPDARMTYRPGAQKEALSGAQAKKRQELEALLAAPIVYQPSRSADGRSIAFPAREGRTRSIFFVPPGGKARALVRYAEDDGQEMSQVAVSADGGLVAFIRGGAPNSKGEVPDPRSLPEPPKREIFVVETKDGTTVFRTEGHAPQFSPDGKLLIWRTGRGVVSAPIAPSSGQPGVGTPAFLLSGTVDQIRFSPDGSRIAYERLGGIETLDLRTRTLRLAQRPPGATDRDPSWSRDGSRLAFRRISSQMPYRFYGYAGPAEVPLPWSIHVAEGSDMKVREVWKADKGVGSDFYPLDQDASKTGLEWTQLFWSDSDEIAFIWERDGWRHLYAVPAIGGAARLLTPGEGEIESAAVSLDGKQLVYAHNIGDLDRRQVSAVPFAGGAPVSLSSDPDASQWSPTALADGGVAYVEGGWSATPHIVVREADGRRTDVGGVAPPAHYPGGQMAKPQAVSFTGTDGQIAFGQLFVPKKSNGCGVIFVHGGIRRQMLLGYHYIDIYSNLYELNQYFTLRGCVVLSIEYRSSIMRGHAFRNPPEWGSSGASEYKDVLGGARYLLGRKDLGVKRLGIYGLSWGGYLTAQAIARNSDVFSVGFDMAGVHEFAGDSFRYSPAAFAEGWRSPVLLASGDDDRNVDMGQTMMLVDLLNKREKRSELEMRVYPNEVHDIYLTFDNLTDLYWRGSEFMLRRLVDWP